MVWWRSSGWFYSGIWHTSHLGSCDATDKLIDTCLVCLLPLLSCLYIIYSTLGRGAKAPSQNKTRLRSKKRTANKETKKKFLCSRGAWIPCNHTWASQVDESARHGCNSIMEKWSLSCNGGTLIFSPSYLIISERSPVDHPEQGNPNWVYTIQPFPGSAMAKTAAIIRTRFYDTQVHLK